MARSFLVVATLVAFSIVSPAQAILQYYYYGATLGEGWDSFPTKLVPNIEGTPGSFEELNVTLPIYLVWENVNGTQAEISGGPIPITDLSWWDDSWDEVIIAVYHSGDFYDDYTDCSTDISASLNYDGELTVVDENFGGIGSNTQIQLHWCFEGLESSCEDEYIVVIQWDRPATYYDDNLASDVDAGPGTEVVIEEGIESSNCICPHDLYVPQQTVEWVSTDARNVSKGAVDSSDLAELSAHLNENVVWGFDSDGGRDSLTFHVNFAPFTTSADDIDQSDLAAIAADLSDACSASKATATEVAAMLEWFGIAATGEEIFVNGEMLPEYAVVDEEKNRNAINDPNGYLRTIATSLISEVPWGQVKSLYK